ncbi:uncharacterized protein LOC122254056 [Penaeus japonicus]|uniref:uncharacterized protein LOC122254056 n=1 Tax=Penaeus japonicus TaxID=27405 RepID=UPI001C717383|nr:uncharacterized protein LOC122254056 [Penaeus japonicus]
MEGDHQQLTSLIPESATMLKAFSISNKRGEILFISTFEPTVTKDAFYPFLSEISSSPYGDPPPAFSRDGQNYVYIFRDDLYWACILGSGSLTKECGHMVITDTMDKAGGGEVMVMVLMMT